ncbi:TPA: hypothetical protein U2J78_004820 [Serratia marcescens]|nr:hypothetical protein [Serratia marcescens]
MRYASELKKSDKKPTENEDFLTNTENEAELSAEDPSTHFTERLDEEIEADMAELRAHLQAVISGALPGFYEFRQAGYNLLYPKKVDIEALQARVSTMQVPVSIQPQHKLLEQAANAFLDRFRLFRKESDLHNNALEFIKFRLEVNKAGWDEPQSRDYHQALKHSNRLSGYLSETLDLMSIFSEKVERQAPWETIRQANYDELLSELLPVNADTDNNQYTAKTRGNLTGKQPDNIKFNAIVDSVTLDERISREALNTETERLSARLLSGITLTRNYAAKPGETGETSGIKRDIDFLCRVLQSVIGVVQYAGQQIRPETYQPLRQKEARTKRETVTHELGKVRNAVGQKMSGVKASVKMLSDKGNKSKHRVAHALSGSAASDKNGDSHNINKAVFQVGIRLLDEIQQTTSGMHKAIQTSRPLQQAVSHYSELDQMLSGMPNNSVLDAKLRAESGRWRQKAEALKEQLQQLLGTITTLSDESIKQRYLSALREELNTVTNPMASNNIIRDFDTQIKATVEGLSGIHRVLGQALLRLSEHGQAGGKELDKQTVSWLQQLKSIKDNLKTGITQATGHSINNFSRQGMLVRWMAEWHEAEKQRYLGPLSAGARAATEKHYDNVFFEVIPHYLPQLSKESDPQGERLLQRLRLEVGNAAQGTTLYPATMADILAGMKSREQAIRDWSERKLIRGAFLAACLGGFKLIPNLVALPLRISLKFVITGTKVAWASHKGRQGIRGGEGDVRDEIAEYAKESYKTAAIKIVLSLPPGLAMTVGAASIAWEVYEGGLKGAGEKIAKNIIGEAPWYALDVGGRTAVNAYTTALVDDAVKEAEEQENDEQNKIKNKSPQGETVETLTRLSTRDELLRMAGSSDTELQMLATELLKQRDIDTIPLWRTSLKSRSFYSLSERSIKLGADASDWEILHELAHALTAHKILYGLKAPQSEAGLYVVQLNALRQKASASYQGKDPQTLYYLNNINEFVAGLYSGNRDFINHLRTIDVEGKSIITLIVELIAQLLNVPPERECALSKAMELSDSLINMELDSTEESVEGVLFAENAQESTISVNLASVNEEERKKTSLEDDRKYWKLGNVVAIDNISGDERKKLVAWLAGLNNESRRYWFSTRNFLNGLDTIFKMDLVEFHSIYDDMVSGSDQIEWLKKFKGWNNVRTPELKNVVGMIRDPVPAKIFPSGQSSLFTLKDDKGNILFSKKYIPKGDPEAINNPDVWKLNILSQIEDDMKIQPDSKKISVYNIERDSYSSDNPVFIPGAAFGRNVFIAPAGSMIKNAEFKFIDSGENYKHAIQSITFHEIQDEIKNLRNEITLLEVKLNGRDLSDYPSYKSEQDVKAGYYCYEGVSYQTSKTDDYPYVYKKTGMLLSKFIIRRNPVKVREHDKEQNEILQTKIRIGELKEKIKNCNQLAAEVKGLALDWYLNRDSGEHSEFMVPRVDEVNNNQNKYCIIKNHNGMYELMPLSKTDDLNVVLNVKIMDVDDNTTGHKRIVVADDEDVLGKYDTMVDVWRISDHSVGEADDDVGAFAVFGGGYPEKFMLSESEITKINSSENVEKLINVLDDRLSSINIRSVDIKEQLEMLKAYLKELNKNDIFNKIKNHTPKNNYHDIIFAQELAVEISQEASWVMDSSGRELLAALIYKAACGDDIKKIDIGSVLNEYQLKKESLSPYKNLAIRNIPDGYTRLRNLKDSNSFEFTKDFNNQFYDYRDKYSDIEAKVSALTAINNLDLTAEEIIDTPKSVNTYTLLGRDKANFRVPDNKGGRRDAHSDEKPYIYIPGRITVTQLSSGRYIVQANLLVGDKTVILSQEEGDKLYLPEYNKNWNAPVKSWNIPFMGGQNIPSTLRISNNDVNGSAGKIVNALFDSDWDKNPLKNISENDFTLSMDVKDRSSSNGITSGADALYRGFRAGLNANADTLHGILRIKSVAQLAAETVIPFYEKIYNSNTDKEFKADSFDALIELSFLIPAAKGAGAVSKTAKKFSETSRRIIAKNRAAGLSGKALWHKSMSQIAPLARKALTDSASAIGTAVYDAIEPVPLKAGASKLISLYKKGLRTKPVKALTLPDSKLSPEEIDSFELMSDDTYKDRQGRFWIFDTNEFYSVRKDLSTGKILLNNINDRLIEVNQIGDRWGGVETGKASISVKPQTEQSTMAPVSDDAILPSNDNHNRGSVFEASTGVTSAGFRSDWVVKNKDFTTTSPDNSGIYKIKNDEPQTMQDYDNFIKKDDVYYRVKFDENNQTWRLIHPSNPENIGYQAPVRRNNAGEWEIHTDVGLKGGCLEDLFDRTRFPGKSQQLKAFTDIVEHEANKWPKESINKKIHMIWIGTNNISEKNISLSIGTAQKNPDYNTFVMYDSEIPGYENAKNFMTEKFEGSNVMVADFRNKYYLNELKKEPVFPYYEEAIRDKKYAQASDILRLLLLKYEGGIYKDIDDIQVKGFGDLEFPKGIGVMREYAPEVGKSTAFPNTPIAATKNNQIINRTLEMAAENYRNGETNVLQLAGPNVFTQALYETIPGMNPKVLGRQLEQFEQAKRKVLGLPLEKTKNFADEQLTLQEKSKISRPYDDMRGLSGYVENGADHSWTTPKKNITNNDTPSTSTQIIEGNPSSSDLLIEPELNVHIYNTLSDIESGIINNTYSLLKTNLGSKYDEFLSKPHEKCANAATEVAKELRQNNYTEVKIFELGIWPNGGIDTMPTNHYVVMAKKGGVEIVVDLTAGQFERYGFTGTIIDTKNNWISLWKGNMKSKERTLVKLAPLSGGITTSPFNMDYVNPQKVVPNGTLLQRPTWYKKDVNTPTINPDVKSADVPSNGIQDKSKISRPYDDMRGLSGYVENGAGHSWTIPEKNITNNDTPSTSTQIREGNSSNSNQQNIPATTVSSEGNTTLQVISEADLNIRSHLPDRSSIDLNINEDPDTHHLPNSPDKDSVTFSPDHEHATSDTSDTSKSGQTPVVPTLRELSRQAAAPTRNYGSRDVVEYSGGISQIGGHSYAAGYEKADALLTSKDGKPKVPPHSLTLGEAADKVLSPTINKYHPKEQRRASPPPGPNADMSGLVGVPAHGTSVRFNIPLESDVDGNEILYRTMSPEHALTLRETKKLSPTTETSVSPAMSYSEGYNGVLMRITVKSGTIEQLKNIGRGVNPSAQKTQGLPKIESGWGDKYAGFKQEGNQTTVHLGTGAALDIVNENIVAVHEMKIKHEHSASLTGSSSDSSQAAAIPGPNEPGVGVNP